MSEFDSRALRSSAERPASTASGYAMLLVALATLIGIIASAPQIGEAAQTPG